MEKWGVGFLCRHGLRQGDPLSSFLFIIVVDPLCRLLNHAASCGIFEGLGSPWIRGGTKMLQYADDMLIFAKARKEFMAVLKIIL